jgi:hypothetical protein
MCCLTSSCHPAADAAHAATDTSVQPAPAQAKRLFAAKSRMPERQGLTIFDVNVF